MKKIIVKSNGRLTKVILDEMPDLPFNWLRKALRKKDVRLNGKKIGDDLSVKIGDEIIIYAVDENENKFKNINVIYEDEKILILDKPKNMEYLELYEKLLKKYSENSIYGVHRLDRNTQGLIIFARGLKVQEELLEAFKKREIEKVYRATVFGKYEAEEKIYTAYLIKDSENSKVTISDDENFGELIKTGVKLIQNNDDGTSLLEVELLTGKTHQIRAHLAYLGYPIIGDGKYGIEDINRKFKKNSQELVSYRLKFHFSKESSLNYLDGMEFFTKLSQN